jgi:hypothetical protein
MQHRREINKKTRSGDKKLRKQVKEAKNASNIAIDCTPTLTSHPEKEAQELSAYGKFPRAPAPARPPDFCGETLRHAAQI